MRSRFRKRVERSIISPRKRAVKSSYANPIEKAKETEMNYELRDYISENFNKNQ